MEREGCSGGKKQETLAWRHVCGAASALYIAAECTSAPGGGLLGVRRRLVCDSCEDLGPRQGGRGGSGGEGIIYPAWVV